MNSYLQAIIQKSYKKRLNLEEIPFLLTIKKLKPKELNKNKNICVTNSCFLSFSSGSASLLILQLTQQA